MEQLPRHNRRILSTDGFLHTAQPVARPGQKHSRPAGAQSQPLKATDLHSVARHAIPAQQFGAGQPQSTQPAPVVHTKHTRTGAKKHRSLKKVIKRTSLVLAALIVISGGWFGWKMYRNIAKVTNNSNPLSLLSAFKPVTLKGQSEGRVNILLAGNSADDVGHDGAQLTDSIMIFSLNTRDNSAFMLSIPRDLWVSIPAKGSQKINAAATVSNFQAEGYPSGGMGQLESIIQENLGITINYYALINYAAFRDAVNAVGGITVNIQSSDQRGLYDPNIGRWEGWPLKLSNGSQTLDGQTALNLARARGDSSRAYGFPGSDFDRTAHQRLMLMALKQKAGGMNLLADPVKVSKLADAIGNNVKTDMQLNEIETLYSLTKGLGDSEIDSYNINNLNGKQLLVNYTSPSGQSALAPAAGVSDFSAIRTAVAKLVSTDPIVQENASAVILNGSTTVGLATRQANVLENKGLTATAADAPAGYSQTLLIDNTGGKMTATKAALQKLYGVTASTDANLSKAYPTANFIIVLGLNYATN